MIEKLPGGNYRVRWYEAGRDGRRRSRSFTRKADARLFEAELMRRRALGEFAFLEASNKRVEDLARDWWEIYAKPNLAYNTLAGYAPALDKHVLPRLGSLKLRDVTPEVLGRFRADLEKAGVGRSSVRISLVVVPAMFSRAQEWGWVANNPARAVRKPSGARQRAVVCLEPARVEDIRSVMIADQRDYAALMVSLAAYAGLRIPEEVLGLEWRHIRERTLLVEQRLIEGQIVAGQKVRHFRPRAVDLVAPLRQDLARHRLRMGRPDELIFARRDGQPWLRHDYQNWRRRIWHAARDEAGVQSLPPYHLRHAFASLQIRAGTSLPELAEQLGHSPQMTLSTYAHVLRELKGLPAVSAETQIQSARESRRPLVDHGAVGKV